MRLFPILFNIALESVVREVLDDATGLRIGEGHQITLAAYADDIIIIEETKEDLKRLAENLISKGKEIGLQVNEKKTKYLIVSRREQVQNSLVIGGFTFERSCMPVEHGRQQSRTRKDYYYLKEKYCIEFMGPKETRKIYMNEELMQN
ncbi:hypothetical protein QTP88_021001 [Uroleucon formosanum]